MTEEGRRKPKDISWREDLSLGQSGWCYLFMETLSGQVDQLGHESQRWESQKRGDGRAAGGTVTGVGGIDSLAVDL